jgi:hypothetical protein
LYQRLKVEKKNVFMFVKDSPNPNNHPPIRVEMSLSIDKLNQGEFGSAAIPIYKVFVFENDFNIYIKK